MKKEKIIEKLENLSASLRGELEKHDGSTLQTLGNAIKSGYDNLKGTISESGKAQKIASEAKKYLDEAGSALKKGDRKLTGKALDSLDKFLKKYEKENEDTGEEK